MAGTGLTKGSTTPAKHTVAPHTSSHCNAGRPRPPNMGLCQLKALTAQLPLGPVYMHICVT